MNVTVMMEAVKASFSVVVLVSVGDVTLIG